MKKKLAYTFTLMFILTGACIAQEKIEKYCEVSVREGLFHKVWVDLGSAGISFKDSSMTQNLSKIKSLKNVVDVLDYMNKIGWHFESSLYDRSNEKKIFYFKKTFDKSELIAGNEN